MTASTEHRLANDWITKSALEASSAYLWENFAIQSDQGLMKWLPPTEQSTPPYQEDIRYSGDRSIFTEGDFQSDWYILHFMPGMLAFLKSTVGWTTALKYRKVTYKTLLADGTYACLQGVIKYPEARDYKPSVIKQGLRDIRLYFSGGRIIT